MLVMQLVGDAVGWWCSRFAMRSRWLCLAVSGRISLYLAESSYIWLDLVVFERIWLYLALKRLDVDPHWAA